VALDLAEDNIDHNRHDQVLSDTGSMRLLSFVADGTASRSVAIKELHCRQSRPPGSPLVQESIIAKAMMRFKDGARWNLFGERPNDAAR
jgi:hypothetical protein